MFHARFPLEIDIFCKIQHFLEEYRRGRFFCFTFPCVFAIIIWLREIKASRSRAECPRSGFRSYPPTKYAPVAQLDRVSDSDSEGRKFESCRAYHKKRRVFDTSFFCIGRRPIRTRCKMEESRSSPPFLWGWGSDYWVKPGSSLTLKLFTIPLTTVPSFVVHVGVMVKVVSKFAVLMPEMTAVAKYSDSGENTLGA